MNPAILVVEDEFIVSAEIEERITAMGYRSVGSADRGDLALELVGQEHPDLILMDIRLKGEMDGITAAEEIRRRFHLPVIFLTAYSEDSTLERAKLVEPYGYILKPFDDRELKSAIEIALYRHKAEQEILRLNRLYDVLSQVNQAVVRIHSRQELLQTICRLIVERGGFDLAWFEWIDPESGQLNTIARFGQRSELLHEAGLGMETAPENRVSSAPPLQIETIFVSNNCNHQECPYPADCLGIRLGFRSCGSFPIHLNGCVRGVLRLGRTEPGYFQEKEKELLQEVAMDISFALEKMEADARRDQAEEEVRQSEERYRLLIETTNEGIFVMDAHHRLTYANAAMTRMLGYPLHEIIGRQIEEFIPPEDRPLHEQRMAKRRAGLDEVYERQLRRRNGTSLWALISAKAKKDSDGKFAGSFAMILDITERKRAEEEALRAHEKMARLVAAIPFALIGLAETGRIMWWNAAAEKTFGLRRDEVLGRPLRDCELHWEWVRILGDIDQGEHCLRQKRIDDVRYVRPDGTEGFLGITLSPMGDIDTEECGLILLAQDITNRKHMESQLAQAQMLESIGQLAAGIAHEINTPTQYVGNNTVFLQTAFQDLQQVFDRYAQIPQALKEGISLNTLMQQVQDAADEIDLTYLLEEIPTAIQQTLDGIEYVAKIARAMKQFSHPGSEGKITIDLNNAIDSTITVARNEWKYHANVITDFDQTLPLVPCFPNAFNQVILNMIVNAVHAISDVQKQIGAEKGLIRISTRHIGDEAEIRVSDTGAGIPHAIQSRIFDPFFTTKEVGKGTGQGLAISHSVIVEKHGGSIAVESEVGKGTTFIIRLPIAASVP